MGKDPGTNFDGREWMSGSIRIVRDTHCSGENYDPRYDCHHDGPRNCAGTGARWRAMLTCFIPA